MDSRDGQATVNGVTKSSSRLSTHACTHIKKWSIDCYSETCIAAPKTQVFFALWVFVVVVVWLVGWFLFWGCFLLFKKSEFI